MVNVWPESPDYFFKKHRSRFKKHRNWHQIRKVSDFPKNIASFVNNQRNFLIFCSFLPKNVTNFSKIKHKFGKSEKHQIGAKQNLVPEIFHWHHGTSRSTQSGAIWHHLETLNRKHDKNCMSLWYMHKIFHLGSPFPFESGPARTGTCYLMCIKY